MTIEVRNWSSGDVLHYSMPLLYGEVQPSLCQGSVHVTNKTTNVSLLWPTYNGCFKAIVELQRGENQISIRYFEETLDFMLVFMVPEFTRFVRPIYIKCQDHDGHFQAPPDEDDSPESAKTRIILGAKLIQSFTAEKLYEQGLGRTTFALESDLDSSAQCYIFTSKLTLVEAHSMSGTDLWSYFAKELMNSSEFKDKDHCKWFAFMSFTRYIPPTGTIPKSHSDIMRLTKGHTALGGGGLALFGTGTLHTWAEKLEDLVTRFTDTRRIDRTKLMDDSAYREFYWANYSTGLGASLHELGHTFDLAHTPTGIMARGFDDLYRVFTVQPLVSRAGSTNSSGVASPMPHSPKNSPVHKPFTNGSSSNLCRSRGSSPKPCPLSYPRPCSIPSVLQIEPSFKRVHLESSQTYTVRNYDGSETQKRVSKHADGTETVSEVTTFTDGQQVVKETVKHIPSGKSRTTVSMNSNTGPGATNHSQPQSLPKSPDDPPVTPVLTFTEVRFKDGGAHWYRSSAVLLRHHKWFNPPSQLDPKKPPQLSGCTITSTSPMRLIELRSVPDGVVFHHWEFLHDKPPNMFTLRPDEVRELYPGGHEFTVLAEDTFGNILKKRLNLKQLGSSS